MLSVCENTVDAMYGQQSNAALSRRHKKTLPSVAADKLHTIATLVADDILWYVLSSDVVVTFCPTANVKQITIHEQQQYTDIHIV